MMDKLFELRNLKVLFYSNSKMLKAIEGIDIDIYKGESVAIVGESGCGKSVTCKSILRLLPDNAFYKADKLSYYKNDKEIDIRSLSPKELLRIRGEEISMIFQDSNTSLNPVLTIGEQISEMFTCHLGLREKEAKAKSIELLKLVGIPEAEKRYNSYPHELSGGQKQRIMIAISFALNPSLILADEPTTALDVTIQKQILDLLTNLVKKENKALLLITHDLGLVRKYTDRLYIMYCGKIVESGYTKDILSNPKHPYTKGLLDTVLSINQKEDKFITIKNNVPSPLNKPEGCHFNNRCPYAIDKCLKVMPKLTKLKDREVRCHLIGDNDDL